ncbi:MAG: DUF2799 domain-containing protein [Proteobacteria bacterium]|nr:MAG: DUF2799 domain-containing protein [Pseudomonadota bacterium]
MNRQSRFSSLLLAVAVPVALLSFTACSGKMSKSDCEKADFYEIGLKDGKKGKDGSRLADITATCGSHGVTVVEDKYTYGRKVGLTEFCDASQAQKDAKKGITDSICAKEAVPPYQTAYSKAVIDEREAKAKEIKELQARKGKLEKREGELQNQINTYDSQTGAVNPSQPVQQ